MYIFKDQYKQGQFYIIYRSSITFQVYTYSLLRIDH